MCATTRESFASIASKAKSPHALASAVKSSSYPPSARGVAIRANIFRSGLHICRSIATFMRSAPCSNSVARSSAPTSCANAAAAFNAPIVAATVKRWIPRRSSHKSHDGIGSPFWSRYRSIQLAGSTISGLYKSRINSTSRNVQKCLRSAHTTSAVSSC